MDAANSQPARHNYSSPEYPIHQTLYNEAQRRIDAGICTVPTILGSKAPSYVDVHGEEIPLPWKQFLYRLPSTCELGNYFQPAHIDNGRTGIGILGGKYSIVERNGTLLTPTIIDIDDKLTFGDFERLCRKDGHAWDILQQCLLEHSRRGAHIAAFTPALYATRRLAGELYTDKATGKPKIRPLIELKVNFVVTAPTRAYTLVRGDWAHLPVVSIEDMDHLIGLAQSLNKLPFHPSPNVPLHTPVPKKEKPVWTSLRGLLQVKRLFTSNIGDKTTDVFDTPGLREATHRPDYAARYAEFLGLPAPTPGKKFSCVLHQPDHDPSMNWLAPRHEGESWRIVCHHPTESAEHFSLTPPEFYFLKIHGRLPTWKQEKSSYGFWWLKLLVDSGCLAVPDLQFPKLPPTAPDYVHDVWQTICHIYSVRSLRSGLHHYLPLVWRFIDEVSGGNLGQHFIRKALRWLVGKGILACVGKLKDKLCLYSLFGNRKLRKAMKDTDIDMSKRDLQDVEPLNETAQDKIDKADADRNSCDDREPDACYQCGEVFAEDPHECASLRASPVPS
jgi:hypothetical protein